jgi:diguanylate cyclase (GGDEF)-like protein
VETEDPGARPEIFRQDHHYAGLFWTPVDLDGARRDQQEEYRRNWRYRTMREVGFLLLALPVSFVPIALAAFRPEFSPMVSWIHPGMFASCLATVLLLGLVYLNYRNMLQLEFHRALLDRMVATDPLTRLGNRRAMWEALERELQRATRQKTRLTLVLIDLDRFKRINDIHGHAVGDLVLKCFADALRRGTRQGMDFAFRIGGDEFVVLLNADVEESRTVTERIRATFLEEGSAIARGVPLACSMGFTAYQPGESLEDWVHRADVAMYRAKASGGGVMTEETTPMPVPASEIPRA